MRLVVGTPPGAAHDTIARLIAERLREGEDQPILVENRPGAAGRIAVEAVRNAAPDGKTLLITPSANMVAQPLSHSNLPYDPFRDSCRSRSSRTSRWCWPSPRRSARGTSPAI